MRPVHPTELPREAILPALGRLNIEIDRLMGISRQTLYDLQGERQPVTAPMVPRISKLTGATPENWLSMQSAHDLKIAACEAEEVAKIPTPREAA